MHITVTYPDRTYGTCHEGSEDYLTQLTVDEYRSKPYLYLEFSFNTYVKSYSYSAHPTSSGSSIKSASLRLSLEECEELALALISALKRAKTISTPFEVEFPISKPHPDAPDAAFG